MLIKELKPHLAVLPDSVIDIIEGIEEASAASLEVINELLEFEKLAAGMTTLECVPTPILPFLERAMKQHLLSARSKEIVFELVPSVETRSVTVNVDPCKFMTVFKNILSNAIKFTKRQGHVTIRVDIQPLSLDGIKMLEVSVKDSGAGLSPANLDRLFGEGVQFNANGLQDGGGSGLGLFITKGQ
jgi:signal transduction histidine kinase